MIPSALRYSLLAILGALLHACAAPDPAANSVAVNAAAFANSPAGLLLREKLAAAADSATRQYATRGTIDAQLLVAATLDGSATGVQSLAGTPQAESPGAIASAVTTGAGLRAFDNTVSPIVAATVIKQIQGGTDPGQAIQNLATTLNVAAAEARAK